MYLINNMSLQTQNNISESWTQTSAINYNNKFVEL